MALADIVLTDSESTPVDHTFSYVGTNGNKVIRKDLAAAAETPITLTFGHQSSVRGGVTIDSHLARLDWTVQDDDDDNTPYPTNCRVVIEIARPVNTAAHIENLVACIADLLGTAGWAAAFGKGSVG